MAFGGYLQANTAVDIIVGPFVDETDGKTAETGLTITQAEVRLSKNGGNMAQKNEATALAHDELGNYMCKLDTTDTNTEGILTLMIHESGALPIKMDYMVLAQAAYISHVTAKDTGYMDTHVKTVEAGIIANASFNADVGSTAHGTNIIALACRKILEELNLDHLLKVDTTVAADGDLEVYVVAGTVLAHLMSANKDVTGFKCTTDSLEAIKVHADTIKAETALIVADTSELQTDDIPGALSTHDGKLDTVDANVDQIETAVITNAAGTDIAADIIAIKAETVLIVADTGELQTDDIPGKISTHDGKLDTVDGIVDNILTDTGTTLDTLIKDIPTVAEFEARSDVAGTAATPAEVNAEVLDVLNVDTFAEPGQEAPGATVSLVKKLGYLYKFLRNKITDDGTDIEVYNDAKDTVDQKASVSEAAGTVTRDEFASGP